MVEARPAPPAVPGADTLRDDLLARFRAALDRPDLEADDGFLASGGDSLTVMETILDIESTHNVALSVAEFMALDTAELLARHIAAAKQNPTAGSATGARSTAVHATLSVVQDGPGPHPMICAYGLDDNAAFSISLPGLVPAEQPVAALQFRAETALRKRARAFREVEQGVGDAILAQYGRRPGAILGYSLGAHVALAVGHDLARCGAPPALIAVLDDEADLDQRDFGACRRKCVRNTTGAVTKRALGCSPAEPIATRIVYFRSTENEAHYRSDPTSGWGEIATGGVTHYDIAGNHLDIAGKGGLRQIVPRLLEEMAGGVGPPPPAPSAAQLLRFEARRAAREGDLAAELAALDRVIAEDREQPAWLFAQQAKALFQNGDLAAGLAAVSMARRQERWQLSLDLRLAQDFRRPGLEAERAGMLQRVADTEADHPSVHEQKARLYSALGLWKECGAELRAGLAMQPDHIRLSRLQVRFLRHSKRWRRLVKRSERLVDAFPAVSQFRSALIEAYVKTGAPARALRFHDAILAESQPDIEGLIALAVALLRCERPVEAGELVDLALQAMPTNRKARILRDRCRASGQGPLPNGR